MGIFDRKSIRKIIDSEEAYAILDSTKANGSTWCAGGCAILAHTLNIVYGLPVYIIYNHTLNHTEHFGVKTPNNTYVDCDGEQREWLRNFKKREFYMHPEHKLSIMQYTNGVNISDIIIDMDASQKLAKLFKPEPVTKTIHTLHEGLFY